jgi:hypothetical protein
VLPRSLAVQSTAHANAYIERFIGSVRRECRDRVIVLSASGLRRVLKGYLDYATTSRTHLALEKDTPVSRPVAGPTVASPPPSDRELRRAGDPPGTRPPYTDILIRVD